MDMETLLELIAAKGKADRAEQGQKTLGYLRDMLRLLPEDLPCQYDTGHNFGLAPVTFRNEEAYEIGDYTLPAHHSAFSETAYPSAYRGYYADCTFNAEKEYEVSTVAHVLSMIENTIGKSFDGYKGGINSFSEGTLVWGGGTSHSSCGENEQIVGIKVVDHTCIIETKVEEI